MKPVPVLGKLEKVDPRQIWEHEALSFTPWLALPENLAQLGEALGIELELEAQEQAVGPFRADILCRRVGTTHWVLIENQLERTDHSHLGQILTYAAGLDAVTVIWVSPQFTDEHRACLDWLNRCTVEELNFFGVVIEAWKIGDSPPAALFKIVSQPNQWSKSVAAASASLGVGEVGQTQLEYWTAFYDIMAAAKGPVRPSKPQASTYMTMRPFGRPGFFLAAGTDRKRKGVKVELYLDGKTAPVFYPSLRCHREELADACGNLRWYEGQAPWATVDLVLEDADPTNRQDWPRQHAWLRDNLAVTFHAFAPIIRALKTPEEEEAIP